LLKSRRFWVVLLVTSLFLFLFFYQTDFSEMGKALREANYLFILPAIVIYFVGVFFRAVRWHYLLLPLRNIASVRLFPLVVIGFLVNNVLPARLGTVARSYLLGERERMSKMSTFATIVVEQVFDGLTLLLFAAGIALFIPLDPWLKNVIYIATGLFFSVFIICLFIASSEALTRRWAAIFMHVLPLRVRSKVEGWFILFMEGLKVMRSPRKLVAILAFSAALWLCEGLMFYFLSFSFNLGQPFHVLLLATAIANLALFIPTPGGIGPFDYFCKRTLVFFNVPAVAATAYVAILHFTLLVPVILLGFIFLWTEKISLTKLIPARGKAKLAEGYDGVDAPERRDEE